ncbi:MAG: RnfABCDGE type electron transport complex subunit D [Bacteroidales bacterium]|nr:RnfABCDGE type electron transport complex subunit D [Bacteroidales bacterium]MDD3663721.1 RnfABCDGE type electron transport complex subunit D [Bacteroidales bacterium]
MNLLTISGSPHVHNDQSVKKIMFGVIISLIPAMLVSFYFFGLPSIILTLTAVISCALFEFLIQKYLLHTEPSVTDGSAMLTGLLLAFNVPSNLPIWMMIVGSLVAIGIGKMSFGGLGKNPFNPALVGRVFLLISFPVDMTSWPLPQNFTTSLTDVVTGPTPLGIVKEGLKKGDAMADLMTQVPDYVNLLLGNMGGSIGEVSALAIIIGGLYMLVKKIISWHIPVAFIGSVLVFAAILNLVNPALYVNPLFHLVTGGLMLGAIYMATDMVTSPMSALSMIIYGVGCGILTVLIRVFGAYPEGVSFAILIMNALTPILNKYIKPKRFGEVVAA